MRFQVVFYQKDNGIAPAEDFINSLDEKMKAKAYRLLVMVSENGTELREPYSKYLEDGIFELRVKFGNDISRILYFFYIGKYIIVTNGFIKKTQKTPKQEIDKDKEYRRKFIEKGGI